MSLIIKLSHMILKANHVLLKLTQLLQLICVYAHSTHSVRHLRLIVLLNLSLILLRLVCSHLDLVKLLVNVLSKVFILLEQSFNLFFVLGSSLGDISKLVSKF